MDSPPIGVLNHQDSIGPSVGFSSIIIAVGFSLIHGWEYC